MKSQQMLINEFKRKMAAFQAGFENDIKELTRSTLGQQRLRWILFYSKDLMEIDIAKLAQDPSYRAHVIVCSRSFNDLIWRTSNDESEHEIMATAAENVQIQGIKKEHFEALEQYIDALNKGVLPPDPTEQPAPTEDGPIVKKTSAAKNSVAAKTKRSLHNIQKNPVTPPAVIGLAAFIALLGGQSANKSTLASASEASTTESLTTQSETPKYVFNLVGESINEWSGKSLLSTYQQDYCKEFNLAYDATQLLTGDKKIDAGNKQTFAEVITALDTQWQTNDRLPILGKLLYDAARTHNIDQMAYILSYFPEARTMRFNVSAEQTMALPELLLKGCLLSGGAETVHPWSAEEMKTLFTSINNLVEPLQNDQKQYFTR